MGGPFPTLAKFRVLLEGQVKPCLLVLPLTISTSRILSKMTTAQACKLCDEPLVLSIDDSEGEGLDDVPIIIPDDVRLACHCHYHWYAYLLPV